MEPLDTKISKFQRFLCLNESGKKLIYIESSEITVKISENLTTICDGACRVARELTSVTIPPTIKCIGISAFSCPKLKEIIFTPRTDNDELYVKEHAFDNTPKLVNIKFPLGKIQFEGNVFGPAVNRITFLGPPPVFAPDTFNLATLLRVVVVNREYIDEYTRIFSEISPKIRVEHILTKEEKQQQRKEYIMREKERSEKRKLDATVRVFLPADQACEIRWTKKANSSVPSVVSQSYPIAEIEIECDGRPESKQSHSLKITKLRDWDEVGDKAGDIFAVKKGGYYDWKMYPGAPQIAHDSLKNLTSGGAFAGITILRDMMAARDNYEDRYKSVEYEVAYLKDLTGKGLLLEYRIIIDPEKFDIKQLQFFSFKGEWANDIENKLCGLLSRCSKPRFQNKKALAQYKSEYARAKKQAIKERDERISRREDEKRRRQEGMDWFDRKVDNLFNKEKDHPEDLLLDINVCSPYLEDTDVDDNIIWYDFIRVADQIGVLMKVYRVEYDDVKILLDVKKK